MVKSGLNPCGSKTGLCYLKGNKITKEGNKSKNNYIIYLKLRNGEKT